MWENTIVRCDESCKSRDSFENIFTHKLSPEKQSRNKETVFRNNFFCQISANFTHFCLKIFHSGNKTVSIKWQRVKSVCKNHLQYLWEANFISVFCLANQTMNCYPIKIPPNTWCHLEAITRLIFAKQELFALFILVKNICFNYSQDTRLLHAKWGTPNLQSMKISDIY